MHQTWTSKVFFFISFTKDLQYKQSFNELHREIFRPLTNGMSLYLQVLRKGWAYFLRPCALLEEWHMEWSVGVMWEWEVEFTPLALLVNSPLESHLILAPIPKPHAHPHGCPLLMREVTLGNCMRVEGQHAFPLWKLHPWDESPIKA